MKTSIALLVFLFGANILLGCSSTVTQAHREESARPGIEQRALSRAMDEAFSKVDFSVVGNKRVYVETQGLSKIDMPFVTSLISSKIIENGGLPVDKEETADIKTLTIVKVSGTDEVKRRILSDKVTGQFKGTFTFVDIKRQKVIKTYKLDAEVDEVR